MVGRAQPVVCTCCSWSAAYLKAVSGCAESSSETRGAGCSRPEQGHARRKTAQSPIAVLLAMKSPHYQLIGLESAQNRGLTQCYLMFHCMLCIHSSFIHKGLHEVAKTTNAGL